MIFAFDHRHEPNDICSVAHCVAARRAPVLAGDEVHRDIPMRIVGSATPLEYLQQPLPAGWILPPLGTGPGTGPECTFFYRVEVLD